MILSAWSAWVIACSHGYPPCIKKDPIQGSNERFLYSLNSDLNGNPNLELLYDITSMSLSTKYTLDWDGYDEILVIAVLRYSTATNYAHCFRRITKNEWELMSSFTKLCDDIAPATPFIISGGNGAYANIGLYFRSPTSFSVNGAGGTYAAVGVKIYKLIK